MCGRRGTPAAGAASRRALLDSKPIWMAVIALAAVLAFAPSLGNDWVFDDTGVVVRHPAVLKGSLMGALLAPYWPPHTSADLLYRPLTTASYHLEAASTADGHSDAARSHATNLLLHVAASQSVFLLAGAAGLPGAAAGLAAVLFATHPVHTEAVVTGYGRAELLAGLLGALLLWLGLSVPPEERRPRHLAALTMLFLLAVAAKEHALMLWPAILILDLARRSRLPKDGPSRTDWVNRILPRTHVCFAVVAILFLLLRWSVLGGRFRLPDTALRPWEDPLAGTTPVAHGLTVLRLLWLTVRVLGDPGALCPIWSYPALAPATSVSADVLGGAAVACAWLAAVVLGLRRRAVSAALAAALLPLLWVVLHLPPAPHWIFAERWLYLPSVAIAVLAATALKNARSVVTAALAALLAALLIPSSRAYAREFASDLTMARATVARQPSSFQGVRNLALVNLGLGRWSEAVALGRELEGRFGPTPDAEWVILNGSLQLLDRAGAEDALGALQRRFRGDEPVALQFLARRVAALPRREAASGDPGSAEDTHRHRE